MRYRWLVYILIGLGFGFIDWYFLAFLRSFSQNQTLRIPDFFQLIIVVVMVIFNYGVWLIPAIPAAVYETRHSQSFVRAAMAAIIVWSMALFGYYSYYAFMLMFIGLPSYEFMLISNRHLATYWIDWWPLFKQVIVDQFVEWIGIAVLGGALVGIVSAYISSIRSRKREKNASV